MKQLNETEDNSPTKLASPNKEYSIDPDWDEVKHGEFDYMRTKNGKESYY